MRSIVVHIKSDQLKEMNVYWETGCNYTFYNDGTYDRYDKNNCFIMTNHWSIAPGNILIFYNSQQWEPFLGLGKDAVPAAEWMGETISEILKVEELLLG